MRKTRQSGGISWAAVKRAFPIMSKIALAFILYIIGDLHGKSIVYGLSVNICTQLNLNICIETALSGSFPSTKLTNKTERANRPWRTGLLANSSLNDAIFY